MMLTREEIFVIYEAGPEAVISVIQRLENIIEEEQAVRIAELEERVRVLEARLNQNSQNSSKPPSTDVFCSEKHKPKSSRTISGKKAGGQKGHPGKTLETVSYTHLRAHETRHDLVCRLLLEKKKKKTKKT